MDKTFRIRLAVAYIVIALFGLAVVTRAACLMLLPSERLQVLADRQFRNDGPPKVLRRGQILDRNREPLAVSLDVKSVYVNPAKVDAKSRAHVAQQLSLLLHIPVGQVREKLKEHKGFVWIKRQLPEEEAAAMEHWLQHNRSMGFSVGLASESKRFYPNQNLASTLLGFTNVDSHGIEGLEYSLDEELSGRKQKNSAVEGNAIVLTIDKNLQNIVERELEEGVANTGAKSATGIIMDARTGDIVAMGSYPNYNPNNFKQAPADWRRNRAVTDTYEPGSTMKPIMISGAVEAKVVTPATKVFCEYGKFQVGKHWIREAEAKDKWGWLRVDEVIQKSSNVGATKIGFLFGSERLFNWTKTMGLTVKTGVDFPGEVSGGMPALNNWAKIHLSNISFGQGISVTPIQMLRAYATIANDGKQAKPHLLKEWRSFEGDLVHEIPVEAPRVLLQPATAQQLQAALSKVTTSEGTAPKAAIPGFRIAGKTGTAQKPFPGRGYKAGKYIASFVGFPLNVEPRYVALVLVDEPHFPYFGGEAAAPIFRKIMTAALAKVGAAPDENLLRDATPAPKPSLPLHLGKKSEDIPSSARQVIVSADGLTMPNLLGASAREVLETFDHHPVDLKIQGSGAVVEQFPRPGTVFKKGEIVSVRLDRGSL